MEEEAAFIKLDGLRPKEELSDEDERAFFATKLAAQVRGKVATPANWYEAFVRLGKCINDRRCPFSRNRASSPKNAPETRRRANRRAKRLWRYVAKVRAIGGTVVVPRWGESIV